ncbi:MAG: DNA adenine methylase [Candidatus Hodarchaeales archaeon]|jgi:site-specific DNA-adenine methylase
MKNSFRKNNKIFQSSRFTIASYPGGKSDRKKHLTLYNVIPSKIDNLVEPFVGLANFYFVISPRVKSAWLNDKNTDVYALLSCIQNSTLLDELTSWIHSINPIEREDYYEWKHKNPTELIERAVRLLVILNCSPNGAGGGYSSEKAHRKWYENKPKIWLKLSEKLQNIHLTNKDYKEVLNSIIDSNEINSFIYLDPPYYEVAKKGNLYREHNIIDWKEFKEILDKLENHWIMSNRDCSEMREFFNDYYQNNYNTYNDMNNTKSKNPELLISNNPLKLKESHLIKYL